VAHHVFERNAEQKQMDGIQAAVGLVIRAAIHRQFKLGERRDFSIGQLTWAADAAIISDSNSRTSLLCRVSVIIFGNGSNMARTEQIIRLRILGRMTPQSR
jgi:hypothetical protein